MPNTYGRQTVLPLTNKSGGGVIAGDVVIIDTTNNEAFTTTTTAAYTGLVGIAQETIANNATGRVLISGYAALVNVNASVTRGNYGKTHTVAKQGTDAGSSRVAGAFCQFLTGGTTPTATLLGFPDVSAGALTDHTHAATGSGANGGGATLAPTKLTLPTAMGTGEGEVEYDTATDRLQVYDGQRERGVSLTGWSTMLLPIMFNPTAAYTTASSLAANGGTVLIPMFTPGHMLLEDVSVYNTDTGTARTWMWDLYAGYLNNGNSGENTLARVATGAAAESFTPGGAASRRFITAASAPVYLPPGVYYLAIQCQHATNAFNIGTTAQGTSGVFGTIARKKTTTNPNGSTLDAVAITWNADTAIFAAVGRGRVHGMTTVF